MWDVRDILKVLGDENRVRIVLALQRGEVPSAAQACTGSR